MLPKIHLHCHLEGALRAPTFLEFAAKHGVETTYRPQRSGAFSSNGTMASASVHTAEDVYRFSDFKEFLLTFAAISRSLCDPDDYARLAREFAEDALAQGVIYGELFISPSVWQFFHPEIDVRACIQAIFSELNAATASGTGDEFPNGTGDEFPKFKLIVDLTRNFGVESAMRSAKLALESTDVGVIGIGLGGDEANYPPELFADAFAFARANGLHCVAHAGEAAGPQSIRNAVDYLHVERIGHGIRALEDAAVTRLLAERAIPLEVCPTSNFLTGAVPGGSVDAMATHPILELDAAGCIIVVDVDDPAIFRTSISQEYENVASLAGEATLTRFVANAIEASFAEKRHKANMLEVLKEKMSSGGSAEVMKDNVRA